MKKILFINHKITACGVYQYGLRTGNTIKKSLLSNIIYVEVDSVQEYNSLITEHNPSVIIYNNHGPVMPWLSRNLIISYPNIIHVGILHEGNSALNYGYNYYISQDPTINDTENIFSVPRPLLSYDNITYPVTTITTINSFGFSFSDKGFKRVIDIVCSQLDDAIINLHMTTAHFDRPKEETEKVLSECQNSINKTGVKLNITRDFLNENELLNFLASGDINLFPYDSHSGRGISSVIDYALSVDRPIAITKSNMFRHIIGSTPSICIEDRSLIDIIKSGVEPIKKYKEYWSNNRLIEKYDYIIKKITNNE